MKCASVFYYGFFFQAEDGIRDLVRSRGLGDVYKRQRGELAGDRRLAASALRTHWFARRAPGAHERHP